MSLGHASGGVDAALTQMASWLLPAVKLILPHVGTLVAAAKPAFTKRKAESAEPAVVQQQIAELQNAASQNAAHVREVAEKLELTVTALEQAASAMQQRVKRLYTISVVAILVALSSLTISIVALLAG